MEWETDPPMEWRAKLPSGWTASASSDDGKRWFWNVQRKFSESDSLNATGESTSADEAKAAIANAYERLSLAFCAYSPEEMPHALSSLLASAWEMAKVTGMGAADRSIFEQACARARSALAHWEAR